MTTTKDDNDAGLPDAWTTGHAAALTSPNQAGIEVHADKLAVTNGYSKIAGQPFVFLGLPGKPKR
jgi:hypothetical protein